MACASCLPRLHAPADSIGRGSSHIVARAGRRRRRRGRGGRHHHLREARPSTEVRSVARDGGRAGGLCSYDREFERYRWYVSCCAWFARFVSRLMAGLSSSLAGSAMPCRLRFLPIVSK